MSRHQNNTKTMDNLRRPYGQDVQPLYRYPHSGVGQGYRPDGNLSPFPAAPALDYDDVPYYRTPPSNSRSAVGAYDQPPSHFKLPADFLEGQFNNNKTKFIDNTFGNQNNRFVMSDVELIEPVLRFLVNKPSYRIYCKASGERLAVAIRDDKIVLARPIPTDPTQHWYKDERYSTKVKDKESQPSFILVNKGTAQAIKHSVAGQPVQLFPYETDEFDVCVLWTESTDLGNGFRTIRKVKVSK